MATQNIFNSQTTDGMGIGQTNSGDSVAIYTITLGGSLEGAFCTVLYKPENGTEWVPVGALTDANPSKLIMITSKGEVNCRLDGMKQDHAGITVWLSS